MALSKELADAIVSVVITDPESYKRIDSWLGHLPLPYLHISWAAPGDIRNYWYAWTDTWVKIAHGHYWAQPTREQEDFICYGISNATIDAIKAAVEEAKTIARLLGDSHVKTKEDVLGSIASVSDSQWFGGFPHQATKIVMPDKSNYVFDWWRTLDPFNPLIYPSEDDFQHDTGKVEYKSFKGFP